jgi:hypothetical protein
MKRPAIIHFMELLIFIVLVAGSLLLLVPVSRQVDKSLLAVRDSLLSNLERQTGLRFRYDSLSPSVFRSIKISGLVITDATNGSVIADVSSVSISCSISALLTKNYGAAIRDITIENGTIKVDYVRNQNTLRLLKELISKRPKTGIASEMPTDKKKAVFGAKSFTVRIRNIDIGYSDLRQDISVHISRGSAILGDDGINLDLQSRIKYDRPSLARPGGFMAGLNLKGSLSRDLESGSASLVVHSLESGLFSVSRIGLVTSYRSGTLFVSSVQDLQPVDVSLIWKIPEKNLSLQLECERLLPLRWVQVRDENARLANLKNMALSGSASIHVSQAGGFEYDVDMTSDIPEAFYSGARVECALSGNASILNVKRIAISGKNYDIDLTGSYNVKGRIPEGFLSVRKMLLPSGAAISGDFYIDGSARGFTCISPTLTINRTSYSSVTFSAAHKKGATDFDFSAIDSTGKVTANGTLTSGDGERFLQVYAACDSVSVADIVGVASSFAPKSNPATIKRIQARLAPYALTTEVYVTSDLSSFSFNCPRLVLASSKRNGLIFLFSAKGNENGIDITDMNCTYGIYTLTGNISAGYEQSGGIIFNTDLVVNDIPYSMNGMYSNRAFSLYGDYNMAGSAVVDDFGAITGSLSTAGFPIPVGPLLLSCALNTRFSYDTNNEWKLIIDKGSLEDINKALPLSTVAQFSGYLDRAGLYLENVSLSDAYSTVSGYAGIGILDSDSGERQYTAEVSLASPDKTEAFLFSGRLRDMLLVSPSDNEDITPESFFEASVEAKAVPLMRFASGQQKDNLASFTATLSGTPTNLMASADVSSVIYRLSGFNLDTHGKFLLEDGSLSLYDAAASWNGQVFTEITGTSTFEKKTAVLKANYSGILGKSEIKTGISVDFTSSAEERLSMANLAERFTVHASLSELHWKTVNPVEPLECTFVHEPGITAIYAGKNDAITGYILDDGSISIQAGGESPVWFQATGGIVNSVLAVNVNDVHVFMPKLWPLTGLGIVEFDSGSVDGSFVISGMPNDPDFNGTLRANNILVRAPGVLQDSYGPVSFDILAEGKTVNVPWITIEGKEGAVSASAVADFDRWLPTGIRIDTHTLDDKPLRVDTENPYFKAKGSASFVLDMAFTRNENIINGDIYYEEGSFAIVFSGFLNQEARNYSLRYRDSLVNLNLHVGNKVEFRWPSDNFPILRGLIQAEKPLELKIDTVRDTFQFKGEAALRGGEIYYIKRSFYLRNGSISFNENQDVFNPIISVRAEIRERDEDGQPVRIIMTVDKQPLSSFVPVFTADPIKTDAELMVLLGQAASGDTKSDTLLQTTVASASDIFTRIGVFRDAENKIRDFMHLDIFSIRTLILQNAILGSSMQNSEDKKMTFGNYFDNTTVYMGKYLGSAIYADALLHFSYYDPKTEQKTGLPRAVYGNLLFQPEFGLEVATPFFLLRWGITPESLDTLFVTDNKITLSWKFSY